MKSYLIQIFGGGSDGKTAFTKRYTTDCIKPVSSWENYPGVSFSSDDGSITIIESNYIKRFGDANLTILMMDFGRMQGINDFATVIDWIDEIKAITNKQILIVLSKADLVGPDERKRVVDSIRKLNLGVPIRVISAKTGEGCDEVLMFPILEAKKVILRWWKKKRHFLKSKKFRDLHVELEHKPGVGIKFFKFEGFVDGVCAKK